MSPPRSIFMNPVDRSSHSPQSSTEHPQQSPPVAVSSSSESESTAIADSEAAVAAESTRQQPIPAPSEPMQYRAIGLVRGQYMPSADQFTRGTLVGADESLIDAVLLGRVMSLVKNHLSLDEQHLWVVYPRTRQKDGNLHLQIVGVWEPEKLHQQQLQQAQDADVSAETKEETPISDGYFSIRGEVMFQARDEEKLIVKIKQSPRTDTDKPKFFKLQLKGVVNDKVVGHFLDFQVQREGNDLLIQESKDIGRLQPKRVLGGKKPFRGGGGGGKRPPRKNYGETPRPVRPGDKPAAVPPPKRTQPISKPIKRNAPSSDAGQ